MKKTALFIALSCCMLAAHAEPFAKGNVDAGKKLFDQNQCNRCHVKIVGGDGNAIFTNEDHKVKNPQQLVDQMHVCTGNIGITLSKQDEDNLGAYLNKRFYHFK